MRGVGIVSALIVAWALGLGCDEVLARVQNPHVAQSMSAGADPEQLQSAVWAWIVATAVSPQFLAGAGAGLILAETGRFVWRWAWRVLGGAAQAAQFLIHHRLIVVCTGVAAGYAVVRFVIE
jgi:hypothetical protein